MRAKRGIGVSFDKATLDMIDSLLSQCQYQRSLKEGGDAVCALDGSVCNYERCQRVEKKRGAFYKQFESRSKFISYCIEFVASIAESDESTVQKTIGFIMALSEDPELGRKLCFFLKELK